MVAPPPPPAQTTIANTLSAAASDGSLASSTGLTISSVEAYEKAPQPLATTTEVQENSTLSAIVTLSHSLSSSVGFELRYSVVNSTMPACGSLAAQGTGSALGQIYNSDAKPTFTEARTLQAVACVSTHTVSDVFTVTVVVPAMQPTIQSTNATCVLDDGQTPCEYMEIIAGNGSDSSSNYQMWYTFDEPQHCSTNADCGSGQTCKNAYCTSSPTCSSGEPVRNYQYDGNPVKVNTSSIMTATACADGLSESSLYTVAVSIQMLAPVFEFSSDYPREITNNALLGHPQKAHLGFQIWQRLTPLCPHWQLRPRVTN